MTEKHHPCSPSSLYRRSMCPASLQAEAGLPEKESEFAAEGTLLHSAVWVEADREGLTADQLMLIDMVDTALTEIGVKYSVAEWQGECKTRITDADGNLVTHGSIDAWGIGDDCVVIVDFKTGYKEVELIFPPAKLIRAH